MAQSTAGLAISPPTRRRLHKVPGHLNDALLLTALFPLSASPSPPPSPPPCAAASPAALGPAPPVSAALQSEKESEHAYENRTGRGWQQSGEKKGEEDAEAGEEVEEVEGEEEHADVHATAKVDSAPLYPLTRELALVLVRDLRRLCLRRADGLRHRCREDARLRDLTPSHPLPLEDGAGHGGDSGGHRLFLALLHRLLLRLGGVAASASELLLLMEQAPLIGRAALRLDTASRRRFLTEAYSLQSPHNADLSPAVLCSMAAFSARQSRAWFSDRRNPLAHLRFSTPLAQLDGVPRMACPHCKRQSVARPACAPGLRTARACSRAAHPHTSPLLRCPLCVRPQSESVLPRGPVRRGASSRAPAHRHPPRLLRHVHHQHTTHTHTHCSALSSPLAHLTAHARR